MSTLRSHLKYSCCEILPMVSLFSQGAYPPGLMFHGCDTFLVWNPGGVFHTVLSEHTFREFSLFLCLTLFPLCLYLLAHTVSSTSFSSHFTSCLCISIPHLHTHTYTLISMCSGCSGIWSKLIATLDAVRRAYRKRSRRRGGEAVQKGKSAHLSLVPSSRFILPSATSDIYVFLPFSPLSSAFPPICFPSLLILSVFLLLLHRLLTSHRSDIFFIPPGSVLSHCLIPDGDYFACICFSFLLLLLFSVLHVPLVFTASCS